VDYCVHIYSKRLLATDKLYSIIWIARTGVARIIDRRGTNPKSIIKSQNISHKIVTFPAIFKYYTSVFLRYFRDPIRVPRIENLVPKMKEIYHRVPRIREIGSLQVHTGYLTFSLKKP